MKKMFLIIAAVIMTAATSVTAQTAVNATAKVDTATTQSLQALTNVGLTPQKVPCPKFTTIRFQNGYTVTYDEAYLKKTKNVCPVEDLAYNLAIQQVSDDLIKANTPNARPLGVADACIKFIVGACPDKLTKANVAVIEVPGGFATLSFVGDKVIACHWFNSLQDEERFEPKKMRSLVYINGQTGFVATTIVASTVYK